MPTPTPTRSPRRPGPAASGGRPPPPRRPGQRRPAPRGPQRRRPDPHRRLEAGLIVVLMILSVIAGRLIQLQGLDRSTYSVLAQDQRLQHVTLTAARGSITDRNGQAIAETVDARDIVADPTQVVDPAATASKLQPLLHRPAADLTAQLEQHSRYALLAHAVAPTVADSVMALRLPGIATLATTRRVYPDGPLASNVVGVVSPSQGTGLSGLEYGYQKSLAGRNGQRIFEVGVAGDPIPDGRDVLKAPEPGTGLRLTLDSDIQWQAQQAITAQVRKARADSGSVVVMDPRNGQVLALAVAPGFDPNSLASTSINQLGDPAVSETYEPGSVNKVITMSAALQDGLVNPLSHFVVPNTYRYAGTTFHDAENHSTEHLTLTGVLARSSNIGTIQVARRLGGARLDHYLRAYGFGQQTGIGVPGEAQGILPSYPSQWTATTLPTVSFGQGIGVTAMQVASVYSTIANNGVRVTPTLIRDTIDGQGRLHPTPAPQHRRVVSAHVAHQMRDMLESVVSEQGTAPEAAIHGYRIAGKTGTAQRPNGHGGYAGYTASFVGMAPADKPQLVVEVVLQAPRSGHFGGLVAAPVFHSVMSFALQSLGIPPTGTRPPKAHETW